MIVQIFKIISAIGLLGVLFVLTTHREIILSPKEKKLIPQNTSQATGLPVPPVLEKRDEVTPSQTTTNTQPEVVAVEPSPLVTPPIAKIEPVAKKGVYIAMEEGQSDTDSSYRPSVSPCKVTMGYTIGEFDTHFGISKAKFIEEIDAAAALWGDQFGKKLFTYNEKGPLTINLIYDERQARTEDVNNLALEIENAKGTADTLKKVYEQEKIIYLGDGEQLTKDSEALKARYQVYSDKVAMYNSQGGAPQAEYNQMTQELEALKQQSKDLTVRRDALLTYMEVINSKVSRYNELVVYINSLITKSNSLGAKKFTEGKFTPRSNTIDIYQYNNLVKLRRVIAHELGHVLGINHTESLSSIMYAVNSGTTTVLGADDIVALKEVCPQ
jgi:predicted Zn-dependent protease